MQETDRRSVLLAERQEERRKRKEERYKRREEARAKRENSIGAAIRRLQQGYFQM
jgi:hypothetical protein